jgi:hypothetical protein
MTIETYQRCPPSGGIHWRVRDPSGRIVEESQGAFYADCGDPHVQARTAAEKLWGRYLK